MLTRLRALVLSTHPGPGIAVTIVAIVLAIGLHLDWWRVLLVGFAFLFNQASVGLSNDWIDADRDREVGRTDKPVALGQVGAGTVRDTAFVCFALALLLTIPLGWQATIAHFIFIASAWAYNAVLKNTWFSVLPYIISFALLPMVVTLSRPEPAIAAPWALGVGAMLGIAAHFANVLPDLDDDARTGIAGLPHRIGRRAGGVVIWAALAVAGLLAFFGPAGGKTVVQWIAVALTLLLVSTANAAVSPPPIRAVQFVSVPT